MSGRKAPIGIGHAWDWFVPFITTPTNIAKQMIRYSPLGLVMNPVNYTKSQVVRAGIGSTFALWGASLAAAGDTTWTPPKDAKLRAEWYAAGNQPYSIKVVNPVTGEKVVIPMMYLLPFSLSLALPAALHHAQTESKEALSDSQLAQIGKAILEISRYTTTQTSLTGMDGFLKIIEGNTDYRTGAQLGFVGEQVLPGAGLVRYINTLVDPIYRKSSSFMDTWQKDYPLTNILRGQPATSKTLPPVLSDRKEPVQRLPINYIFAYPMGFVDEEKQRRYEKNLKRLQERYARKIQGKEKIERRRRQRAYEKE